MGEAAHFLCFLGGTGANDFSPAGAGWGTTMNHMSPYGMGGVVRGVERTIAMKQERPECLRIAAVAEWFMITAVAE